ncbi:T9SS type A sorting domain-containing protein [Marinoscillum furvescens]|uniref:Putative secreted protein (Por secretion system target) n=1 Tax=Marinoscillum furvescens DSM 4134 TaxID=1122208 RepID=A0A3D9LGU8_MARFU|nr:T9SS type A sorting domain-containing protein [Marinoscillum furvescens]REE05930.1 putative secreted protein (Por secretion system target) [Marinoscillum furvescens DSM 4134]
MKAKHFLTVCVLCSYAMTYAQCPDADDISNENFTVTGTSCAISGTQNQGSSLGFRTLTIASGAVLTITGDLYIWDRIDVYGTLNTTGNVTSYSILGNSTVYVAEGGLFAIDGNYTNGTEDAVYWDGREGVTTLDGIMTVAGTYTNNDGGTTTVSETGTLQAGSYNDNGGTTTIHNGSVADCESGCCGADCDALPVVLLNFEVAANQSGEAILTWETASELNNDYFEIQKREANERHFQTLTTISGQGTTSSPTQYTWSDPHFQNDAYYRLVQVDYDGSATMLPTKILLKSTHNTGKTSIFPNPTHGSVTIQGSGYHSLTLYDESGKTILQASKMLPGELELLLNQTLQSLKGNFLIQLSGDNFSSTHRLVKH